MADFDRLRLLEPLARDALRLDVWSSPEGESAWQLSYPDSRMTLVLSAAPSRGFSGEGRLLAGLAAPREEAAGRIRAALRWQGRVDVDEISGLTGIDRVTFHAALQVLATQGLLGFDLAEGAYFHRELPFRRQLVEVDQPRLRAARKLVASGALRVVAERGVSIVEVPGSRGITDKGAPRREWRALHMRLAQQARRRARTCKHILAARAVVRLGRGRLTTLDLTALAGSGDADAALNVLLQLDEPSRRALARTPSSSIARRDVGRRSASRSSAAA